jgi:hypothetical protein
MEQPSKIKNDYSPELTEGKPSEHQIIKEFSYLFDYVLNGYGVPFQLRKFLFKIFALTKDGKTYSITDFVLAEQLGNTSRNYVVNLRKKLKAWFNAENENGIRNYPFISIRENSYDTKLKKQLATEYQFSLEFSELLQYLTAQIRKHPKYKENFIIALKEVCGAEKKSALLAFGFWDVRKKKRERSADNILGTYLLNFKRITRRICEFVTNQGFDAEETKDYLKTLLPQFIDESFDDIDKILTSKPNVKGVRVYPGEKDFNLFMETVLSYVNEREEKPITILPKAFSRLREKDNVCSSNGQFNTNGARSGETSGGVSANNVPGTLEFGETFFAGKKDASQTALDIEHERFFAKHQKRE